MKQKFPQMNYGLIGISSVVGFIGGWFGVFAVPSVLRMYEEKFYIPVKEEMAKEGTTHFPSNCLEKLIGIALGAGLGAAGILSMNQESKYFFEFLAATNVASLLYEMYRIKSSKT